MLSGILDPTMYRHRSCIINQHNLEPPPSARYVIIIHSNE
jgi:hypothetical protein